MLVFTAGIAQAQKTQEYDQPDYYYNYGLELYQKELYGPAITQFANYMRVANNKLYKTNAAIYTELAHLKLGHENSENTLVAMLEAQPENALNNLAYFELGNFYFDDNKFKKAAAYYEKTDITGLSEDKMNEMHFKMGYSFFKANKPDKAKLHFESIRNRPNEYYAKANYYYGYMCYTAKNYDCAIKSFEKTKDEEFESIPIFIAQMHYGKGDYQKAIDYCNKITNAKYANDLNLIKGKSSFQLAKYDEAYKYFSKCDLVNLKPTDEERYEIGYSFYSQKKYDEAINQFVKLSSLDSPLGQIANFYMAQAFYNLKKKQNAYNAFGEAKRLNHNTEVKESAHFNYAKLAVELGYSNVALKSLQDFINNYPKSENNDDAKGLLAELFLQTKNYKQACEILSELKSYNAQSKSAFQIVHFHRGEELFLNQEYTESEKFFNKSLKFAIDKKMEGETYYWMGEIDYKNGKYSEAISNYNRFINISEASKSSFYAPTYYSIGYSYYLEKNYTQALNYFKKYKDESTYIPSNSDRYIDNMLRLGDCYFLSGQYEKAAESYGFVSSKKVNNSDYATFQQGIIYGLMDKRDLKIATLRNIPQYYAKSQYIDDALFEIGSEYLEEENFALSENFFKKLISEHPLSKHISSAYLKLGLLSYNLKKEEQAITYYQEVIKRFPKTTDAEVALDALEIIYVQGGRGDEYIDMLAKLPGANLRLSYQDSILYQSAITNYNEGNCPKAVAGFKTYLTKFGVNAFFYIQANYMKGECEYKAKAFDEALPNLKIVAEAGQNEYTERAAIRVARIYYTKKDYKNALPYYAILNKSASTKENTIESLVGMMRCNYFETNFQEAKKYAIEILPLSNIPKDVLVETNMYLGRIAMMDKNWRTAQFHFNYVLKENKAALGAEAMYSKAEIQYNMVKKDSCKTTIFKLNDDFPSYEYWVVKGFILLSDVYRDEKDYFQARATLQSIIEGSEIAELLAIARKKLDEINELEKTGNEVKQGDDE
jgi:tetratricopeptide (TPR) repeat protein